MKIHKLCRKTVKEVDPMATLHIPQKLMQESIVKGDDAFVLLEAPSAVAGPAGWVPGPCGSGESPYRVSLLQDKLEKQGLHKWEKWPNLTGVQTSLLFF